MPPYPPASAAQARSTVDVGPDLFAGDGRDGAFVRRLAGHIETGRPSTRDPAIITS